MARPALADEPGRVAVALHHERFGLGEHGAWDLLVSPVPEARLSITFRPSLKPTSTLGAWVTLGSGLAAVAVGAGLSIAASRSVHAANQASENGDRAEFEARYRELRLERGFSYGLLAAGTVAVGMGALFVALCDEEEAPAQPAYASATTVKSVHVQPLPGGGLLSMRGGF